MTDIARHGELIRLARVVNDPSVSLACVDSLDVAQLRELREALSAQLFEDGRTVLKRVAAGAKLLPIGLVARVGEKVFRAMLCAQVAGLMPTKLALEIALRMPDAFLAEVSAALDPRRAGDVIAAIPADRVVAVARHMLAAGDFVTLARFCEFVSRETIGAVIDSIADELDLLHIAAYVERPGKLTELVEQLAPERTRAMIGALHAANGEHWIEALAVATNLDDAWKRRLGEIAASLPDDVVLALLGVADKHDVWSAAVPLLRAMNQDARNRALAEACVPAVLAPNRPLAWLVV